VLAQITEMIAWADRFRGFCYFHLCKVWMSIVGERPLLALSGHSMDAS
jgi:hypothetical protein